MYNFNFGGGTNAYDAEMYIYCGDKACNYKNEHR